MLTALPLFTGGDVGEAERLANTAAGFYHRFSTEERSVDDVLDGYQPQIGDPRVRPELREFVTGAVRDFGPRDGAQARHYSTILFRHVYWCWQVGYPVKREVIFRREVISDSVIFGMPGRTDKTKATVRSHLYRLSEALMEGPQRPVRVPTLGVGPAQSPYSAREVTLLRSWAMFQSTDYRRVNATMLLALSLGAGLSAREVGGVRASHVSIDDEGVLVEVTEGPRPRSVPILADWESPVAQVARAAMRADQFVFLPRREVTYHRNLLANFTHDTTSRPFGINATRLRVTWIVHHLTIGTPVRLLADAAGLESPVSLGNYLVHVPALDLREGRRMLRAAARPALTTEAVED